MRARSNGGKPAQTEYKKYGNRMVPLDKRSLLRVDFLYTDSEMDPFRKRNQSRSLRRPAFPELEQGDLVCVLTWRVVYVKDKPVEWFTFFVLGERGGKIGIVHMDDT